MSDAGPLWICFQVFENQTEDEASKNPRLLFWRNDLIRRSRHFGSYTACWIGKGTKQYGCYLALFLPQKTPWIGVYNVGTHLYQFDLEKDESTAKAFEAERALRAQGAMRSLELFTPERFMRLYGDVQLDMEDLVVP